MVQSCALLVRHVAEAVQNHVVKEVAIPGVFFIGSASAITQPVISKLPIMATSRYFRLWWMSAALSSH